MPYKSEKINKLIEEYEKLDDKKAALERKLAIAGLEANEVIYIGEYGQGKSLILDERLASRYGLDVGDWLASSETC